MLRSLDKWCYLCHLGHLWHHGVGDEHVDGAGPAHPDQLRDGVQEGEAGVGQVVNQEHLGLSSTE